MRGHLPKASDPDAPILKAAIREVCAQNLLAKGCDPASFTFDEPQYHGEEADARIWTIRGHGRELENGSERLAN
jgi:hypothetical protein